MQCRSRAVVAQEVGGLRNICPQRTSWSRIPAKAAQEAVGFEVHAESRSLSMLTQKSTRTVSNTMVGTGLEEWEGRRVAKTPMTNQILMMNPTITQAVPVEVIVRLQQDMVADLAVSENDAKV